MFEETNNSQKIVEPKQEPASFLCGKFDQSFDSSGANLYLRRKNEGLLLITTGITFEKKVGSW